MNEPENHLENICVLITRPVGQAEPLCKLIESAGGRTWRFPTLEIHGLENSDDLSEACQRLARYDLAVFISANAVRAVLNVMGTQAAWPDSVQVAAIGRTTAMALAECGVSVDLQPQAESTSEGLLALAALQDLAGQRVVIFRGDPGRELLADTLVSRGAEVVYVQTYRRAMPVADPADLRTALGAQDIDVITVSSGEGLRNLVQMVGDNARSKLLQLPIIVPSERVGVAAARLGFVQAPLVARGADAENTFNALKDWRKNRS